MDAETPPRDRERESERVSLLQRARDRLRALPRRGKRVLMMSFDVVALVAVILASYSLRLGRIFEPSTTQWLLILAAPALAIPVFVRFGLYRAVIRYLQDRAIWATVGAMSIAALLWITLLFLTEMSGIAGVPRSIPLFYWLFGIWVVAGSRFGAKALLWPRDGNLDSIVRRQVLIFGADGAGIQLAAAIRDQGDRLVAGFIDPDPALRGRDVMGIRVYPVDAIGNLITNFGIREILVSMPSVDAEARKEILSDLSRYPVQIRALPAMSDLTSGRVIVSQLRAVDIDDLLGRSAVPPDPALIRSLIAGRTICVSGAGGSIGSELCRLIMRWKPKALILLDHNEYGLYAVERSLPAKPDVAVKAVLGSVRDEASMRNLFRTHGVEVVFHAAAYKHVPIVEGNVIEGTRNNVHGTDRIARAALECGVKHFVLISSDKAVHPTNVMGATKRWSELIVRHYSHIAESRGTGQKFAVVRFGNVLGSSGSVVPLFREQIERGGPVTLTDERMTRYFMSIHEAAELIVQAGALSEGGDIFLLDMGAPIRIRTLAENMIRLAGHTVKSAQNPDGDIEILITGKRPGEKLYEELFYDPGKAERTEHRKILRAHRAINRLRDVERALADLDRLLDAGDPAAVRRYLLDFIAE